MAAAIAAVLTLFFASAQAQQAPQAFTNMRLASQAAQEQRERVRLIQAEPLSAAVHIARLSVGVLRSARVGTTVRFQVAPEVVVEARGLRTRIEEGRFIWTGEVLSGSRTLPPGLVSIMVSGGDVIGSIRAANGRFYGLRPLGNRDVAIVEINFAAMPPDHPPESEWRGARPPVAMQPNPEAARWRAAFFQQLDRHQRLRRWATTADELNLAQNYTWLPQFWNLPVQAPEITVLVAYTAGAQALHGNIPLLAADAVEQTNNAHFNSKVFARLRLVATMQVAYQEAPWSTLGFVKAYNDVVNGLEGLSSVHVQRDAVDADLVVLIIGTLAPVCGFAGPQVGADAAAAFAIVHYSCATNNFTFAHEIGHLIGARHDMANSPELTPYPWGHGYRICESFGTLMAYYCSTRTALEPPRLLNWSSPLTTWNGVPMGTADLEDVHRVWNERAFEVSLFR
jgi:hypothetical protein